MRGLNTGSNVSTRKYKNGEAVLYFVSHQKMYRSDSRKRMRLQYRAVHEYNPSSCGLVTFWDTVIYVSFKRENTILYVCAKVLHGYSLLFGRSSFCLFSKLLSQNRHTLLDSRIMI